MRRRVCIVTAMVVVGGCCGADRQADHPQTSNGGQTTTSVPSQGSTTSHEGDELPSSPGARSLELHSIELDPNESVALALHPTAAPVTISSSNPDLEICPATLDGELDNTGGSWPSVSGFTDCRPLDKSGLAALPSTGGHVAFLMRPRDQRASRVNQLTVTYDAQDQFLVVFPPSLASGDAGSQVLITPSRSSLIVAQPYLFPGYRAADAVRVEVTQGDRTIRALDRSDLRTDGQPYGPVKVDELVAVQMYNDSPQVVRPGLTLAWG